MRIAVAGGSGVVGRYVVESARAGGHHISVLSRHAGVDVRTGDGLASALEGVDVVVDTLNAASIRPSVASEFFTETSRRLIETGTAQGVRHLVTLSIVGIDRASGYGYYRAKLAQESVVQHGALPATILRATQFHEFPAQLLRALSKGPVALVPHMRSQPVAARTVGEHLVRLAGERPGGTHELAGPRVHDIVDLARVYAAAYGPRVRVVGVSPPGRASRQMRGDALLATSATTIDGPTFDDWLTSPDARHATG
jgi:uncharacterized protein YbjT (DUF2867 family)